MCGRYASFLPPDAIAALFRTGNPTPNVAPTWNMAPTQTGMVVRRHPETAERHLDVLRWGLVPHFTKDLKAARKPINARSETVASSGTFRGALAAPVTCDRQRIGQLLSNLLGNAFVYGALAVPIEVKARAEDGRFELSVANSGDDIEPSALARLFQPFFRGKVRGSREGLGLGLYICSEIAKAHGGTLDVMSNGGTTCFTLRMPTGAQ